MTMRSAEMPYGVPVQQPVLQPKLKIQPARKQIFVPAPGKIQMSRVASTDGSADQELLQSLYEAILITERDGRILDANSRAETLFALSAGELRNRRLGQLIPKLDELVLAEIGRAADEQRYMVIEASGESGKGGILQVEIAASGIRWCNAPGLCLSIRDITRRKEIEATLVMVNNAMYNTVDGIAITTVAGVIQFANPAFAEMISHASRAEVVGRDIRTFIADRALFEEMIRLVKDRNRCAQELMLQGRSGPVPVLASGAPTLEPPDSLTGMVFSFGDISERLRLEDADRQAREKEREAAELQARLSLLSNLEYGLNNPLQALLSMVELERRTDYQEHVKQVVEVIRQFHEAMLSMKPIVATEAVPEKPAPPSRRESPAKSVLVVDDEDVIRELFVRILQSHFPDLKVGPASNGAEAVRIFKDAPVDIIVLDMAMPGLNGEETYHAIETFCKDKGMALPRFVFCTGFLPAVGIRQVVDNDPACRLLMKPVKVAEFVATIRELVPAIAREA